jgi:predicted DNA-binding protein
MLAIRLDEKTAGCLAHLSCRTGRTKADHAREAIRDNLDDVEDVRTARARLSKPARVYSAAEAKRALSL